MEATRQLFKKRLFQKKGSDRGGDGTELAYLFKMICLGKNPDVKSAVERYMEHKICSDKVSREISRSSNGTYQ